MRMRVSVNDGLLNLIFSTDDAVGDAQSLQEGLPNEDIEQRVMAKRIYEDILEKICRKGILGRKERFDGRKSDEIRPITSEVGVLPRTHGSALFTRGETQALTSVTLTASTSTRFSARRSASAPISIVDA